MRKYKIVLYQYADGSQRFRIKYLFKFLWFIPIWSWVTTSYSPYDEEVVNFATYEDAKKYIDNQYKKELSTKVVKKVNILN